MKNEAKPADAGQGANRPQDSWAGAFKAIGLRALVHGKFWQLCFTVILGIMAWRLDRGEVSRIIELLVQAKWFALVGWMMFITVSVVGIVVFRFMRKLYQAEIDRLANERNLLQEKLLNRPLGHTRKDG